MARLDEPVMNTRRRAPAASASSAAYWISGLSTMGSISLGLALVAGRNRVPRPATGNTAARIGVYRDIAGLWLAVAARPARRDLVRAADDTEKAARGRDLRPGHAPNPRMCGGRGSRQSFFAFSLAATLGLLSLFSTRILVRFCSTTCWPMPFTRDSSSAVLKGPFLAR